MLNLIQHKSISNTMHMQKVYAIQNNTPNNKIMQYAIQYRLPPYLYVKIQYNA